MTTIQITLPDDLAKSAASYGFLEPEQLEAMLRDKLRAQAGAELRAIRARLKADPLPPISEDEIRAEIDAVRAEQRRAAGH
jgi:hypothetical protein